MGFYERLMTLDRRWVYLAMALAVAVPLFISFQVPPYITPEVKKVYDFVESLKEGDRLLLAIDYDPMGMAELHPMALTISRQCFAKGVKLFFVTLSQNAPGMCEQLVSKVSKEFNKKNGVDFVYLGYKPYPGLVILSMGQNFRISFPMDYYGTPVDSMPIMQGIRNYDDMKAVIAFESGWVADSWIGDANGRYKVPVGLGVTGVMAADYFPYVQSKQIFGLIGGLKGAAEYETLAKAKERSASRGMKVQTITHAVVILFIIVGNIGFFMSKKRKGKTE
jgi:hypothetical protein